MTWRTGTLDSFITLKRGYDLPSRLRVEGDVPIVSSSGVSGWHNEVKTKGPGVVTGRYGTLGQVFYMEEDFWPLNTSLYVRDFKGNDPQFVAYLLQTLQLEKWGATAAVPGLNRNVLHRIEVKAPPPEAQREIVGVLSAYDDLIANNRQRIERLEEAARLLYQEWFVRLRFPGHETASVENGVPEGWKQANLSSLVTTQYGYTESAQTDPVGPRFLRGMDINKTSYINWASVPYCPIEPSDFRKFALVKGDLLLIRMADPGKCAIIETEAEEAVFASYLVRVRLKADLITPYYTFFALDAPHYQAYMSGAATGSTRKSASAKLLVDYDILIPPKEVLKAFDDLVVPIREQITVLLKQNGRLAEARDILLPRLMSGEITP